MKTKQVEQKGTYLRAFRAAFPYTGAGAHRLSVYRDGVRSDDTGKRLQLLVGNAHDLVIYAAADSIWQSTSSRRASAFSM